MKRFQLAFLLVCTILALNSCKNFLSNNSYLSDLDNALEYTNMPYTKIDIITDIQSTKYISPAAGSYYTQYKQGDSFDLDFTVSSGYTFLNWTVEPEGFVEIEDVNSTKTKAKIITTSENEAIKITPICIDNLKVVDYFPKSINGTVPQDTLVSITFNKPINEENIDFSNIQITLENEDKSSLFQNPKIINDGKTIQINTKITKDNCFIDFKDNNTKSSVTITLNNILDKEKKSAIESFSFAYLINNNTDSVPPYDIFVTLYKDAAFTIPLSSKNITDWNTDYELNHVNKVYYKASGKDDGSGVYALKVQETLTNKTDTTPFSGEKFVNTFGMNTFVQNGEIYESSGSFSFYSIEDGLVNLDLTLVDFSGQESTKKITYNVIKDTKIDILKVLPETVESKFPVLPKTDTGKVEIYNINDFAKNIGKEVYFDFSSVKDEFYLGHESKLNIEVLYGTDKENLKKAASNNMKFTFERDTSKHTYVLFKYEDELGNKNETYITIPKSINILNLKLDSSKKYYEITPSDVNFMKENYKSFGAEEYGYLYLYNSQNNYYVNWIFEKSCLVSSTNSYPQGRFYHSSQTVSGDYNLFIIPYFTFNGKKYFGSFSNSLVYNSSSSNNFGSTFTPETKYQINTFTENHEQNKENSGTYHVSLSGFNINPDFTYFVSAKDKNNKETIYSDLEFDIPSDNEYTLNIIVQNNFGQKYTTTVNKKITCSYDNLPPTFKLNTNNQLTEELAYPNQFRIFYRILNNTGLLPADASGLYKNNNNKNEIEYWFVKFSDTQTDIKEYSENELINYKKYTLEYEISNPDMYTVLNIPYGHLEEGNYTLCMKVKDKNENYAFKYAKITSSFNNTIDNNPTITINNQYLGFNYPNSNGNSCYIFFDYLDKTTNKWHEKLFPNEQSTTHYQTNLSGTGYNSIIEFDSSKYTDKNAYKDTFFRMNFTQIQNGSYIHSPTKYIWPQKVTSTKHYIQQIDDELVLICSDVPYLVHIMYSERNLSELVSKDEAADYWGTKANDIETTIEQNKISTYEEKPYLISNKDVPLGNWYSVLVHFADGTTKMTQPVQKLR